MPDHATITLIFIAMTITCAAYHVGAFIRWLMPKTPELPPGFTLIRHGFMRWQCAHTEKNPRFDNMVEMKTTRTKRGSVKEAIKRRKFMDYVDTLNMCAIKKKATPDERAALLQQMAAMQSENGREDQRKVYAVKRLAEEAAP
jgi:hypothetical protein